MARSLEKADSVFDFLYVDARRIAVLSSQFGTDGILTELVRGTEVTDESSGGLDVKIVKLDNKEGQRTSLQTRFDPQWLVPLQFLTRADPLIERNIDVARLGQLVLVAGDLMVLDLDTIKKVLTAPKLKEHFNRQFSGPTPSGPRQAKARGLSETELGMELVGLMPHPTQVWMHSGSHTIWSSVETEGLLVSTADLLLKHGSVVSGEWSMVGILDAMPDISSPSPLAMALPPYLQATLSLAPLLRPLMGRPDLAYGMTPLVIFREISAG